MGPSINQLNTETAKVTKYTSSLVNFRAHYKIVGLHFFYFCGPISNTNHFQLNSLPAYKNMTIKISLANSFCRPNHEYQHKKRI